VYFSLVSYAESYCSIIYFMLIQSYAAALRSSSNWLSTVFLLLKNISTYTGPTGCRWATRVQQQRCCTLNFNSLILILYSVVILVQEWINYWEPIDSTLYLYVNHRGRRQQNLISISQRGSKLVSVGFDPPIFQMAGVCLTAGLQACLIKLIEQF